MDTLPPDHVTAFVVQLLNVGHTLVGLVEDLAEARTAATGDPAEATRHAVVAMTMGTVSATLASVPPTDVVRATELVEQTRTAILGELQRAARAAEQRERGVRTVRSSHG
jgi:hypothetical protein